MTTWRGIDLLAAPTDGPIALGGTFSPDTVVEAARHGVFAMPSSIRAYREYYRVLHADAVKYGTLPVLDGGSDPFQLLWWCPDPRPVLGAGRVKLHAQARRLARRSELVTTLDEAFDAVIDACRHHHRMSWLDDEVVSVYRELHRDGVAFSSEVWRDGTLVGGALGMRRGSVASLDTAFHREDHMSRLAVLNALARLSASGVTQIDCQLAGPLAASIGALLLPRSEFLKIVGSAGTAPPPDTGPKHASHVLSVLPQGKS